MEHDVVSFGQWLGQYRQGLHLHRAELASQIGCAVVTLRKIEGDERRPSRELAELLADRLGIPPEQHPVFIRVARGELPVTRLVVSGLTSDVHDVLEVAGNLPYATTSFVGRAREVSDVQAMLLRPEVRLLTIAGPPGVGKTRLALEAARGLAAHFSDGLFLVTLAPLKEPGLLLDAVAHTLHLGTSSDRPLPERLGRYLSTRRTLLVLDNFEHLMPAAPRLTHLLARAPFLKILITSRVALELSGEHRFVLLPLFVPPNAGNVRSQSTALEAQERYPSVDLFVQRARAVNPTMALSDANLQSIREICRRLDGLPLAIELTAARAALFTPQELLIQVDNHFALLTGGLRDLPERHLTLSRAIDWSYDLLSPAYQQLFRSMAVFAGGCTMQAVQEVCNSGGAPGNEIADGVTALVADSLLQRHAGYDGRSRFYMLETIREYAASKLASSGEAQAIRRQHAEYYLRLAQAAEQAWDKPDEWDWLRRLVSERDNIRAVLRWALATGEVAIALRLNGALFSFWNTCSVLTEARRWLEDTLALPRPEAQLPELVSAEAKALNVAGYLATGIADHTRAYGYFEQGLELYRKLGDTRGIAWSLRGCAFAHMLRDEYSEAEQLYIESLQLSESNEDGWGLAWSRYGLAFLKLAQGDVVRAQPSLEDALTHLQRENIPLGVFRALMGLGYTLLQQGDLVRAEKLFREGLMLGRETPMLTFLTTGVEGLGIVAARKGEPLRAARLWGAAEAMREVTDERRWHAFQRICDPALAAARGLVSEAAWAQAVASGRALTAAQAVAEALEDPGALRSSDPSSIVGGLSL